MWYYGELYSFLTPPPLHATSPVTVILIMYLLQHYALDSS